MVSWLLVNSERKSYCGVYSQRNNRSNFFVLRYHLDNGSVHTSTIQHIQIRIEIIAYYEDCMVKYHTLKLT